MEAKKSLLTYAGLKKLEDELHDLKVNRRKEVAGKIKEAREQGDLSENAEYDAARNEQSANEGEIVELDYKIKNAQIIEENDDTSFVHIGSTVKVYDEELEEYETYELTGTTESDAMNNKISNESPVGAALLKHKVGEEVLINAPDGAYKLKIVEIS